MTQMHESFENSALVEAWLKEPTFLEPVAEGRVAAIVHHTPQARRWPPQVDLGRFAPMLNATKFVAASVVLALTGGLLFAALPIAPVAELIPAAETATASPSTTAEATPELTTEPRAVSDSELPMITLPDELPEGVESGTIDTPAGPARWVHLAGPQGSLPFPFAQVLRWGDGIASWDGYYSELHTSQDGVTWEQLDLWPTRGTAAVVADTYVVLDATGGRAMTSTDPENEWLEVDASAVSEAKLQGWETADPLLSSGPMMVDDRIVFTMQYYYSLPKGRLGISSDGTKNLRTLPDGRYVLCSAGPRSSCDTDGKWVLRIKETPEGLVVRHDRTGKRLGLIEGATADQIYRGERGTYRRIFAIDGNEVVEIESPWPGLSPWQVGNLTVAPDGTEPVLTKRQCGGVDDPAALGRLSIAADIPKGSCLWVTRSTDHLEAYVLGDRGKTPGAWISTDGVDWTPAPSGAPKGADVRWRGATWLASRQNPESTDHWMHLGGEWVSLDEMGFGQTADPRGIGNVTLFPAGDDTTQELWVLTHPVETE